MSGDAGAPLHTEIHDPVPGLVGQQRQRQRNERLHGGLAPQRLVTVAEAALRIDYWENKPSNE